MLVGHVAVSGLQGVDSLVIAADLALLRIGAVSVVLAQAYLPRNAGMASGLIVGFAVGYYVGTKDGREGLARLVESWTAIRARTDLKDLVGGALGALAPVVKEVGQSTARRA